MNIFQSLWKKYKNGSALDVHAVSQNIETIKFLLPKDMNKGPSCKHKIKPSSSEICSYTEQYK